MEISRGNSLCSYLYFKQAKTSCFSFIFCFFFYRIREQESSIGPAGGEGVGISGRREVVGKGGRRMYTAQIMCTHVL
jgi:hypothetical protein